MLSLQRTKFTLPSDSVYLNCAYMSPLLKSVEKAGLEGMKKKRNPFAISSDDFFKETNELRAEFSKLINAKDSNRVVIIPSVSYGMANVVNNLKVDRGENIIRS